MCGCCLTLLIRCSPDGIGWQGVFFDHDQKGGHCTPWSAYDAAAGTLTCQQHTCVNSKTGLPSATAPRAKSGYKQYTRRCKPPGISPFKGVCDKTVKNGLLRQVERSWSMWEDPGPPRGQHVAFGRRPRLEAVILRQPDRQELRLQVGPLHRWSENAASTLTTKWCQSPTPRGHGETSKEIRPVGQVVATRASFRKGTAVLTIAISSYISGRTSHTDMLASKGYSS